MALKYSDWTIGGSPVVVSSATRFRPRRLRVGYENWHELEFEEGPGSAWSPSLGLSLGLGSEVVLRLNKEVAAQVVFRGKVVSSSTQRSSRGWLHRYRALGKPYEADRIPIFNPLTNVARYSFNYPGDDPEYAPSLSGLTVGQIVQKLLTDHQPQLSQRGIGLSHISEWTQLNWTPPDPIEISGERLWNVLRQFVTRWAPNHRVYVEYHSTGSEIRLADLSSPSTVQTLVMGEDPVEPIAVSTTIEACATRVRILGDAEIEPFELSFQRGELVEDWTLVQENNWTLADFRETQKAIDEGSVQSMTESTVTVTSSSPTRTWSANYWAGLRRGRLRLTATPINEPMQVLQSQQTRRVASNTALAAAGTSSITVDRPFSLNTFTEYALFGVKSDDERPHVWRRYRPSNPITAARLRNLFARDEVYRFNGGSAAISGVRSALGFIVKNNIRYQMIIEIDQGNGAILFTEPVVSHPAVGNTEEDLSAGVVNDEPDDVVVFVPVAIGPIEAVYPPNAVNGSSVYQGLAKDQFGVEETWTFFSPSWRDREAASSMITLAEQMHKARKDPIRRANAVVHGFSAHRWLPLNQGVRLEAKLAPGASSISLGHCDNLVFAIHDIVLQWGGPDGLTTSLSLSTERGLNQGVGAWDWESLAGRSITNNPWAPDTFTRFGADAGGNANAGS